MKLDGNKSWAQPGLRPLGDTFPERARSQTPADSFPHRQRDPNIRQPHRYHCANCLH